MAYVKITEETLHKLERLKRETGIGPMRLLARSKPIPAGLNSAIINTWLNRKTEVAQEEHLEFVLEAYEKIVPIISITPAMRDKLQSNLARAGCTPKVLLNRIESRPEGLSAALISRWATGHTLSARRDLWDAVMDCLDAIP